MELKSTSNKGLFLVAGACSVILVVLVLLTSFLSMQKNALTASNTGSQVISQAPQNEITQRMVSQDSGIMPTNQVPSVTIQNWNLPVTFSSQKQSAQLYTFKHYLTVDDAASLASSLKVEGNLRASGSIVYASEVDKAAQLATLFTYNLHSGAFHYVTNKSLIEQKIIPTAADFKDKTLAAIKSFGINDPTLVVSATYKNKNTPARTYIELHRDWAMVGRPILNSVGLANLPETQKIAQLTPSTSLTDSEEDADIYSSSDQKDGLARQNDFNTMTIGVDDTTGDILSINSNIRPFQSAPSEPTNLISFDDAQKKLQSNQYEFLLTTPAGAGDTPWTRIYPGNAATGKQATVTETTIAYLENPSTIDQKYLLPYYIFRGYTYLTSGYLVEFIATVPAVDSNPQASNNIFVKDVFAAVDTPNTDKGQKQSTFDLTPAPTPTDTPVDTTSCVPPTSQLNPVYTVNGVQFGWSNVKLYQGRLTTSRKGFWYYIPSGTASNFQNDVNQVITQVKSMVGETDFREFDKILEDYQLKGANCPVRVTGASPTLFMYGKPGSHYSVEVKHNLTYADPPQKDDAWQIKLTSNGIVTDTGYNRPYMYYEYMPVTFTRPSAGWNIQKKDLNTLADTIAGALVLSPDEQARLRAELSHAAMNVDARELFVGLINNEELNKLVPLSITPSIHTQRYHFYVGKAQGSISEPVLHPVMRLGQMALELGSYTGN
jgi:hypothetical protein